MSDNGFNEHAWISCACNQGMPTGTTDHNICTRVYGFGPNQSKCEHKRCEKCKPDDIRLYKIEEPYIFPGDHFCPDAIIFNSKYIPDEIENTLEKIKQIEEPRGPDTTPTQAIYDEKQAVLKVLRRVLDTTCVELDPESAESGGVCVRHRNQKKEWEAVSIDQSEPELEQRLEHLGMHEKRHHSTVKEFLHDQLPGHGKHGKKHGKDKDDHGQGGASSSAAA